MAATIRRNIFIGTEFGAAGLRAAAAGFEALNTRLQTVSAGMRDFGARMSMAVSVPAGLLTKGAVGAAMDLETAQMELSRQLDEGAGQSIASFNAMLDPLREKLGMSREELTGAGADLMKMGVAFKDVGTVIETSKMASSAWGASFEEVSGTLGRLQASMGLSNPGLKNLAESIDYVADKSAAAEGSLAKFYEMSAQMSKLRGFSSDFTLSVGGIAADANMSAETAATAWNAASGLLLNSDPTGDQQRGFRTAGIDVENMRKIARTSGAEAAIFAELDALAKLSGQQQADAITAIVGNDQQKMQLVSALVARREDLKARFDELQKDAEAGRIDVGWAKFEESTMAATARLTSAWKDLSATLGTALTPAIKVAAETISGFTRFLEASPGFAKAAATALAGLAATGPALWAAGAGVSVMARAFRTAMLPVTLLGRALSLVQVAIWGTARSALAARSIILASFVRMPAVAIGLGALAASALALKNAWPQLWNALANAPWGKVFEDLKEGFAALLKGDWKGAMAGLRRAFADLKVTWDNVSSAIRVGWQKAMQELDARWPKFKEVREAIGNASDAVLHFIDSVIEISQTPGVQKAADVIGSFMGRLGEFALSAAADAMNSLATNIEKTATALDAFSKGGGLVKLFADLPAPVKAFVAALGMITVAKLSSMLQSLSMTLRGVATDFALGGSKARSFFRIMANPAFVGPLTFALVETLNKFKWFRDMMGGEVDAFSAAMTASFGALAISVAADIAKMFSGTRIAAAAGAAAGAAYNVAVRAALAIGAAIAAAWSAVSSAVAGLAGTVAGAAYAAALRVSASVGTALTGAFTAAQATIGAAATGAGTLAGGAFGVAFAAAAAVAIGAAVMAALEKFDPEGNLWGLTKPLDDSIRRTLGLPAKDTAITGGELWDWAVGNPPAPQFTVPPAMNDNKPVLPPMSYPRFAGANLNETSNVEAARNAAGMKPGEDYTALSEIRSMNSSQQRTVEELAAVRAAVEQAAEASRQSAAATQSQNGYLAAIASNTAGMNGLAGRLSAVIRANNAAAPGVNKVSTAGAPAVTTLGHQ